MPGTWKYHENGTQLADASGVSVRDGKQSTTVTPDLRSILSIVPGTTSKKITFRLPRRVNADAAAKPELEAPDGTRFALAIEGQDGGVITATLSAEPVRPEKTAR